MKSISKLKQASGEKSLNERNVKTLTSERLNRNSNTPDNVINKDLERKNKRLAESIDSKSKESNKLDSALETKKKALEVTGDEILVSARSKASEIIKNAESAMGMADSFLSESSALLAKIEAFEEGLTVREGVVEKSEKDLESARRVVKDSIDEANSLKKMAVSRVSEANELLMSMNTLFAMVLKKVGKAVKNDLISADKISQSLEKASIMYKEAVRKEKLVQADLEYLKVHEAQLKNKEAYLLDREETLGRTNREIERKIYMFNLKEKNNGR